MDSLELVDEMNKARIEKSEKTGYKCSKVKHKTLLKKIRDNYAEDVVASSYTDRSGKSNLMYIVPEEICEDILLLDSKRYRGDRHTENEYIKIIKTVFDKITDWEEQAQIGKYRVDLISIEANLIIEIDEKFHRYQRDSDNERIYAIKAILWDYCKDNDLVDGYDEETGITNADNLFNIVRIEAGDIGNGIKEIMSILVDRTNDIRMYSDI